MRYYRFNYEKWGGGGRYRYRLKVPVTDSSSGNILSVLLLLEFLE